jgi:hypothetical protein
MSSMQDHQHAGVRVLDAKKRVEVITDVRT